MVLYIVIMKATYMNDNHLYASGTWSSPHVTGDVPPLNNYWFTFTKVSNNQVVLHGGMRNKDTYVLDLSRMVRLWINKIRNKLKVCYS